MVKINQIEKLTENIKNLLANRYEIAAKNKAIIDRFLLPAIKNFTVQGITENGLDSTGILYMDKLRNKISSLVMNSSYIWAYIEAPKWATISHTDKLLFEEHTKKVFDVIQETSNFETEKAKIIADYLIGTTAFKVKYTQNLFSPAIVQHCNLKNIYLGDDRRGKQGDVFFLQERITKYVLADSFGYEILESEALKKINNNEKVNIWEATVEAKIEGKEKIIYAVSLDNGFKDIFYYEELEYNPWVIARCELFPGNPYGCGPCIKAIMEIEALKKKKKNIEKVGERAANPSWVAYTNDPKELLRSRLNTPGTISIFKNQSTRVEPFNRGERVDIDMYNISEHKEILRDIFYIDFITAIKDVDDLKNVTATATQVAVSKFAEQIEPLYSMLQKELLKGIVMKVYSCCQLANLVSLEKIEYLKENPRTSLRYYNAITIAQDQDDLQRANMYIQDIASKFGQVGVAAAVKPEEHINALMRRYRVSNKEFRSGEEMEEEMNKIQSAAISQEGEIEE